MNYLNRSKEDFLRNLTYNIVKNEDISKNLILRWPLLLKLFYKLNNGSEDLIFNYTEMDFLKIEEIFKQNNYIFKKSINNNWFTYLIKLQINNEIYKCKIYFIKSKFNNKFNIKAINWKLIKIYTLEQSFAQTICEYFENKGSINLIDLNFLLSKWIIPDKYNLNGVQINNFGLFIKDLLKKIIFDWLTNKSDELNNLKREIIRNLNTNYLNIKLNINILFTEELDKWNNFIPLNDNLVILYKWNNINNKIKKDYAVLNKKTWLVEYQIDKKNKIIEYVDLNIISKIKLNNIRKKNIDIKL